MHQQDGEKKSLYLNVEGRKSPSADIFQAVSFTISAVSSSRSSIHSFHWENISSNSSKLFTLLLSFGPSRSTNTNASIVYILHIKIVRDKDFEVFIMDIKADDYIFEEQFGLKDEAEIEEFKTWVENDIIENDFRHWQVGTVDDTQSSYKSTFAQNYSICMVLKDKPISKVPKLAKKTKRNSLSVGISGKYDFH